ncbi:DUF1993 family protein [Polaromonas sp.]|uniref:DUF1993 domain-containing protein n=1 Tax=Polaromonas sp. TaxID=1869339 RepID=UPI001D249638|nr:DUF1993 domain-containing protein [Polaromonas sp.]MBT9475181.1 DUF1993 domain-containing protein [Polaromonas sp.]
MSLSLHSVLVTSHARMLRNILSWLDKAQAHADAKSTDSVDYLPLRLAPDMLAFDKQALIVCEVAKLGASRLSGVEMAASAHEDTTLQHLRQRIEQTIAYLEALSPAQVDGSAIQEIVVPQRGKEALVFDRNGFVQRWVQPNFFFHATTIYALLRHAGVDLGKADYLGIH